MNLKDMRKPISIAVLFALVHVAVGAADVRVAKLNPQGPAAQKIKAAGPKWTDAERALISGSRQAIIRTGISAAYFDRHFTVVQVVNKPGDRRIVWKFSVNEYETKVSDVLGYYTENGKRVDTHSVTTTLRTTADIDRTISRRAARQLMRQCIGSFRNVSVEYRTSDGGGARLLMTAESIPKTAQRRKSEVREREARERQAQPKTSGVDPIESEGHDPPIITGTVDLQTGKCTKGELVVAP